MVQFRLEYDSKEKWSEIMKDFKLEIDVLYDSGNLAFLSTSNTKDKAWAIIKCGSESELLYLLEDLSIIKYCIYEYDQLEVVESAHELPIVCLN